MFTFGLLRGLRLGYIPKKDFLGTAIKAWKGLVAEFITYNQDGTINLERTVEVGSVFEPPGPFRRRLCPGMPLSSCDLLSATSTTISIG